MSNKYDRAINELQAIIAHYDIKIGFRLIRNKAKNIVEIYGGQEYKKRFDSMVTFNRIGDIRSDEEKYKVVLQSIDNAIHYYKNKSANEAFNITTDVGKTYDSSNKLTNKFLAFVPALIIVSMSFLIYNNYSTFTWGISGWQWSILGIGGIFFALSFFIHKINDKWLAVLLVPFSLILQVILKILGLPL
jgi:hypothetical protein